MYVFTPAYSTYQHTLEVILNTSSAIKLLPPTASQDSHLHIVAPAMSFVWQLCMTDGLCGRSMLRLKPEDSVAC